MQLRTTVSAENGLNLEPNKMSPEHFISKDFDWGLDHGIWSVLKPMFPLADIPVIQLSIDYSKPMEYHYNLAKQISQLREKGVLVIGSGNIVHNLSQLRYDEKVPDWSEQFDSQIASWIESGDDDSIVWFLLILNFKWAVFQCDR